MNATDLKFFKSYLLQQKGSILNKQQEFVSTQCNEARDVIDEAEIASSDISKNVSIELHERERSKLYQIERALGKIEDGQYGICESCSDEISPNRLKARPFATLCIDCKQDQEDLRPVHH